MELIQAQQIFDDVNAQTAEVSKRFTAATKAYRKRTIGDTEYLTVRAEYQIAMQAYDVAFAALEAAHVAAVEVGVAVLVDAAQIQLF